MNIILIGFGDFPNQKSELEEVLTEGEHKVVASLDEADVVFVPHHSDELFPADKPWIAVWIKGIAARWPDLSELNNQPREIITGWKPGLILDNQRGVILRMLLKISAKNQS
jgi:hypothetical protein